MMDKSKVGETLLGRLHSYNKAGFIVSCLAFAAALATTILSHGMRYSEYYTHLFSHCFESGDQVLCKPHGTFRPDLLISLFLLPDVVYYAFVVARRADYDKMIWSFMNPYRWAGYAVSSTVMIVMLYMLFPVVSYYMIIHVAVLNICMIVFGCISEWPHGATFRRAARFMGFLPWAANFYVYFAMAFAAENIPVFVWFAIVGTFLLFSIFPIPLFLQQREPRTIVQYVQGEILFIWLGLGAKVFLAGDVYIGILSRHS